MSEQVKILLNTIIPTVSLAAVLLENLDTNTTGLDDETAKLMQQFTKSAKALIASLPESTIARGFEQTKAFCDNVKNTVTVIIASDIPTSNKRFQCQILLDDLSDSSKIWQAKKGKDADYLTRTKTDVQRLIDLNT